MVKTILMAGGKGTRISSIASDIPKPMIQIAGKPVLEHEIDCLKSQGFKDIIMTVGHLAPVIMNYFGDGHKISPATGQPFGVDIHYYIEEMPLGSAGAVFKLWEEGILTDDFLLLIADALFDIDFHRFVQWHKEKKALATVFTHPNSHPYDSGLVIADEESGIVTGWLNKEDERPAYYKNRVNAGLHVLSPDIFTFLDGRLISADHARRKDLDRDVLKPLITSRSVCVYDSSEYCRDMGTPERFQAVSADMDRGIVKARNFCYKQRAVFLNIDAVIKSGTGYLHDRMDFTILPETVEAIRLINNSVCLLMVFTDWQGDIHKKTYADDVTAIHNQLETLLGNCGAYIDTFLYEKAADKDCSECCIMEKDHFRQTVEKYNIDISRSFVVSCSERALRAGKAAGCKPVLLKDSMGGMKTEFQADSLFEAARQILKGL